MILYNDSDCYQIIMIIEVAQHEWLGSISNASTT